MARLRLLDLRRHRLGGGLRGRRQTSRATRCGTHAACRPDRSRTPGVASLQAALDPEHPGWLPLLPWQERWLRRSTSSPGRTRSTCTTSSCISAARPSRQIEPTFGVPQMPAEERRPRLDRYVASRTEPTPTDTSAGVDADRLARPQPPRGLSRAPGNRRASTPTSACAARTSATWPASSWARAKRRSPATRVISSSHTTRSSSWPTRATRSQVRDQCPDARLERVYNDLFSALARAAREHRLAASALAVEAGFVSHAMWQKLAEAAPDVELVPAEGWVEDAAAGQGAGGARAHRRGLRGRRHGAGAATATIKPGSDRTRACARSRVGDAHHGAEALAFDVACLVRPECGAAARLARAARSCERGRCCSSTSARRWRLSLGHDPDALRRRADEARPRDLRASCARAAGGDRRVWLTPSPRVADPTGKQSTSSRATSSTPPGTTTTTGTGWATASVWPRTRCPSWAVGAPDHAAALADGLLGRAGHLPGRRDGRAHRGPGRFRRGCEEARAPHAVPARGHRRRLLMPVSALVVDNCGQA